MGNLDSFPPFVMGVAGVAVTGFVAWVIGSIIGIKTGQHELELRISSQYVKRDEFAEFRKEFKELSNLMYEIAGKLNVPIRRE